MHDMHIVVIVIAIALVSFGAFTRISKTDTSDSQESVLGDTPAVSPSQTTTPSVTETPGQSGTPTNAPSRTTGTPTPTPLKNVQSSVVISTLIFPGAKIAYQDSSALNLESTDDSDAITDWYKSKIESSGYNAKSFVKTKSNNNVKNSLVGADGKTEIHVEITKSPDSNVTKIFVTIKTT